MFWTYFSIRRMIICLKSSNSYQTSFEYLSTNWWNSPVYDRSIFRLTRLKCPFHFSLDFAMNGEKFGSICRPFFFSSYASNFNELNTSWCQYFFRNHKWQCIEIIIGRKFYSFREWKKKINNLKFNKFVLFFFSFYAPNFSELNTSWGQ